MVRRIIQTAKSDINNPIGNAATLRQLTPQTFVDGTFGLPSALARPAWRLNAIVRRSTR